MKRAKWLFAAAICLAGCSSELKIQSGSDAEKYCREREMYRQTYSLNGTCLAPPELETYLEPSESIPTAAKLTFRRLLDGSLPTLEEVWYSHFDQSTQLGVPFALDCAAAVTSADGERRTYECKVPKAFQQPSGKFVMSSLSVAHEHCGTSAGYVSQYRNSGCEPDHKGYSLALSSLATYAGSIRLPDIQWE